MQQIINIEISTDSRTVPRTVVIEDGALPDNTDLLLQDMVDTLLDKKEI